MPLGIKPKCYKCQTTECLMWKQVPEGQICHECLHSTEKGNLSVKTEEPSAPSSSKTQDTSPKIATRKSARNTRNYKTRLNPYALPKPVAPKGKGRRVIFKKCCTKAPSAVATPVTSDYVFYKGSYYQVGDIVSMRDVEGGLYYAQIRGMLTDQYCEKSCVVTWLLPTQASPHPEDGFDPATYVIGFSEDAPNLENGHLLQPPLTYRTDTICCGISSTGELTNRAPPLKVVGIELLAVQSTPSTAIREDSPEEDIPRKLECMTFVMHAPSDYFKAKNTPYPPTHLSNEDGPFIWTRLLPKIYAAS